MLRFLTADHNVPSPVPGASLRPGIPLL